ncbi:hypothetical protein V2J09_003419 [Rumex salicifolius]
MSVFRRVIHRIYHKPTTTLSRYYSAAAAAVAAHDHRYSPPEHPTSAYYDALVQSAAESGDLHLLRRTLSNRIYAGCFNTNDTFKFVTSTTNSLALLDPLFESLSLLPKGLPRKNALDSLIARLCKLRLPDLALQLFDKMRQRNLEFSTVTFHPILNALARKRDLKSFRSLLHLMSDLGSPPDTTAYNFLLTALCFDGEVAAAADLLETMRLAGLKPDARTYDAMVLGACRAGRLDGAVAVMRAALAVEDVSLLYSTPVHVVTALIQRGYYKEAVNVVVGCGEGRDEELGSECIGVLASSLVKLERFEEAKFVLNEMEKKGFMMGSKLRDFYNLHLS